MVLAQSAHRAGGCGRAANVGLRSIRNRCLMIAIKKEYPNSRLSAMLDHLHLAVRGDQAQSPAEIVLAFQNNLAFLLGQEDLWRETFFVGKFSEYGMGAVCNSPSLVAVAAQPDSPTSELVAVLAAEVVR